MNRNQIVNSEKQKLLQKRTSALLKASNTLKKLMQDEVYANQEIELRKLMIEITKVEIGTKEERALRQKYELLLKKHEQQLEKLGFKKEDLVPQFECKKCNDLGIQNAEVSS